MRWRATLLLALMSVAFVVAGGVALAATAITGTAGNDTLKGTNGTDAIIGKAGRRSFRAEGHRRYERRTWP
jgi:Ca2+-binding RTX toxin-like protein